MANTMPIPVPDETRAAFGARLLDAHAPDYEAARRLHNGMIDKRPALIAQCQSTADVVDAVSLGRGQGVEIAVRGGGHGVAGRAATEGGLMIDLSSMKGIHVDPKRRVVRAEPGLTWREFNRAAAVHGLATTGGVVSSTGIAGLTLGGGIGWLMGKYGLTVDNLVSAEIVTADGKVLTASGEENPDLYWALRGGGGNFGIVTSFEYRAVGERRVHARRFPFGRRITAATLAIVPEQSLLRWETGQETARAEHVPVAPASPAGGRRQARVGCRVRRSGIVCVLGLEPVTAGIEDPVKASPVGMRWRRLRRPETAFTWSAGRPFAGPTGRGSRRG